MASTTSYYLVAAEKLCALAVHSSNIPSHLSDAPSDIEQSFKERGPSKPRGRKSRHDNTNGV